MTEETKVDPKPTPEETKEDVVLDKFNEIKNRYETELSEKDKTIAELENNYKRKMMKSTIQYKT